MKSYTTLITGALATACVSGLFAPAYAGTVQMVQVGNGGVNDGQLNLAGSVTNDILLDSTGTNILSQQMRIILTEGHILQHPFGSNTPPGALLIGAFPALAYDSFVAAGGSNSSSPTPTIVGKSDSLGGPGGAGAVFDMNAVDILYGPSLGQDTSNKTDYLSSRLTLSGDAFGTFHYRAVFGDGVELLTEVPIFAGNIGLIVESLLIEVMGNGTGIANGDATPSVLDNTDFGTVLAGSMQQRTFTINAIPFGPLTLQTPTITGPYSLVGDFPSIVNDSANFTLALDTTAGLGAHPGSISFGNDSDNAKVFSFALNATIVPECASLTLALLAFCGVGCCPRWRNRMHSPRSCATVAAM